MRTSQFGTQIPLMSVKSKSQPTMGNSKDRNQSRSPALTVDSKMPLNQATKIFESLHGECHALRSILMDIARDIQSSVGIIGDAIGSSKYVTLTHSSEQIDLMIDYFTKQPWMHDLRLKNYFNYAINHYKSEKHDSTEKKEKKKEDEKEEKEEIKADWPKMLYDYAVEECYWSVSNHHPKYCDQDDDDYMDDYTYSSESQADEKIKKLKKEQQINASITENLDKITKKYTSFKSSIPKLLSLETSLNSAQITLDAQSVAYRNGLPWNHP